MKKILFMIPTLDGGGAEKVLVNLANRMSRDKYEVTIMTIYPGGVNSKCLDKTIVRKSLFRKRIKGLRIIFMMFKPKSLTKIFHINGNKYDIVITYLEGMTTRIASGLDGIKKVAWVHTEDYKEYIRPFRNKKEMLSSYKKFDKIVAVSQKTKQSFDSTIGKDIGICSDVLYNINDYDDIYNKSTESVVESKDENITRVTTVARLTKNKDIMRLVKIFDELKVPKTELFVIGDGPERSKIEKYVNKNEIKNIKILGYKENPYSYIRSSDIFALLSHKEGYSTAVTEALVLNVPVIATNCSGMEELVHDKYDGILVKDNYEAIKEALKNLLLDKTQRETIKKRQLSTIDIILKKNKTNYLRTIDYLSEEKKERHMK